MTQPANVRINTQFPFPATVQGSGFISLSKNGGIWSIGAAYQLLAVQTPPIGNLPADYVAVWDSVAKNFFAMPLSALVASNNALIKGPLLINQNATAPSTLPTAGMQILLPDGVIGSYQINGYGVDGLLNFVLADGTNANPTALIPGDEIGAILWKGYTGAAYSSARVIVNGNAAENWTPTANGTYLSVYVTPKTTAAVIESIRAQGSGGASFGSANVTNDGGNGVVVASSITLQQNANLVTFNIGNGANLFLADTVAGGWTINAYNAIPNNQFTRYQGTSALPTTLVANAEIGRVSAGGWNGTANAGQKARMGMFAGETWSVSAEGTFITWSTTANTTTTLSERMRVAAGVGIGVTADPGAGNLIASGTIAPGSFTVGTLPTPGTAARMAFASNGRMYNGVGVLEGAAAGTGGLVVDNGTAWKIAGTNQTVQA